MDDSIAEGIAAANEAFSEAYARGDVDSIVNRFFGPGAMVDAGDSLPATTDPKVIAKFFQSMREQGFDRVELRTNGLEKLENYAIETGEATLSGPRPDQRMVIQYNAVWANWGGEWRAQVNVLTPIDSQDGTP